MQVVTLDSRLQHECMNEYTAGTCTDHPTNYLVYTLVRRQSVSQVSFIIYSTGCGSFVLFSDACNEWIEWKLNTTVGSARTQKSSGAAKNNLLRKRLLYLRNSGQIKCDNQCLDDTSFLVCVRVVNFFGFIRLWLARREHFDLR